MKFKHALPSVLLGALCLAASADVVRPAPDFTVGMLFNGNASLKSLRGRPVILLLAQSPSSSGFRSQVKELAMGFDRLATRNVLIFAAFKDSGPDLVQTNMPVIVLPNGPEVCRAYNLQGKSAIALIGPDGNLDYQTDKFVTSSRVRQVIGNSYEFQHRPKDYTDPIVPKSAGTQGSAPQQDSQP
jgi:hypothetical protein